MMMMMMVMLMMMMLMNGDVALYVPAQMRFCTQTAVQKLQGEFFEGQVLPLDACHRQHHRFAHSITET